MAKGIVRHKLLQSTCALLVSGAIVLVVASPILAAPPTGKAVNKPNSAPATAAAAEPKPIHVDRIAEELADRMSRLLAVTFSPDGKTLAVTAGDSDQAEPGELVLWDVESGRRKLFYRQRHTIATVAFSPSGNLLAFGDLGCEAKLMNPSNGEVHVVQPVRAGRVNSVAFTPDGQTLATGSYDRTIKLNDLLTGAELHSFNAKQRVSEIAISPDSGLLVAALWEGEVRMYDLFNRRELYTIKIGRDTENSWGNGETVAFSPGGETFATYCSDGALCVWSSETGALVHRQDLGNDDPVLDLTFSPDGKLLAAGLGSSKVAFYNTQTGEWIRDIGSHGRAVHGVAFSPDGKLLATSSWDRTVKLWNVETSQLVKTFKHDKP